MKKKKTKDCEFAIRCFIDRKRVLTNKLTKTQARNFRLASMHLTDYLTKEYKLD